MKVVTASIRFPSIMPSNGTKMIFLTLILFRIDKKSIVPAMAKIKATSIFCMVFALPRNNMAKSIPSLAESIVAAVLGDTNLFLVSCCIMRPDKLKAIPVIRMLISLGPRLKRRIRIASSFPLKIL